MPRHATPYFLICVLAVQETLLLVADNQKDINMNYIQGLDKINEIIEKAIKRNKIYETVVIILLVLILVAGIILCIWAFKTNSTSLKAFTTALQTVAYFPITSLLKIRSLNIRLQIIPTLAIAGLPPTDASRIIVEFIETLMQRKCQSNVLQIRQKTND
jgi:hypothetical protein